MTFCSEFEGVSTAGQRSCEMEFDSQDGLAKHK